MAHIDLVLPIDAIRHEEGCAWTIELPDEVAAGDDIDNLEKSDLQLWEGDKLLGPGHADHHRIRSVGGGLYSHWGRHLYFSSAIAHEPPASGLVYRVRASKAGEAATAQTAVTASLAPDVIFPRLATFEKDLPQVNKYGSTDLLYNPKGDPEQRIRMLEAKMEYPLG